MQGSTDNVDWAADSLIQTLFACLPLGRRLTIQIEDKKLALAGWLQKNDALSYNASIKLQKFLFLYDAFSKADGEDADFRDLYGYENSPANRTLYETYEHDKVAINEDTARAYAAASEMVDRTPAGAAGFITQILTQDELSALSHRFDIWARKKDRIARGELNIKLNADGFGVHDVNLARTPQSVSSGYDQKQCNHTARGRILCPGERRHSKTQ